MTKALNLFDTRGFDRVMDDMLSSTLRSITTTAYPPSDITRVSDGAYHVTMAVAGFSKDELSVSKTYDTLTVSGEHKSADESEERPSYLHRGISRRSFKREFSMDPSMEVSGAELKDGLLTIELNATIPEAEQPVQIPIL